MRLPPVLLLFLGVVSGSEAKRINCPLRPNPGQSSEKLEKLRIEMAKPLSGRGSALEAFIITADDEHQSEFLADHDRRLEFLTGYNGRLGLAAVTRTKAALWVDPDDYWLAESEIDCDWMIYKVGNDKNPQLAEWLRMELRTGVRVGADPRLVPSAKWEDWKQELEVNHIALVDTGTNPIDDIWTEGRPPYRSQPAFFIDGGKVLLEDGETRESKLEMLRSNLSRLEVGAMIVTALDEIGWLLNVRGKEGELLPFVRSYLIVTRAEAFWYIPREQRTDLIYQQLEKRNISRIRTQEYDNMWKELRTNVASWGRVLIPSRCEFAPGASRAIVAAIPPSKRVLRQSPVIFLKAQKNSKEVEGMLMASLSHSAAFIEFLAVLEDEVTSVGNWTEWKVAQNLEEYQKNQTGYQGPAAPVRVAFGGHAVYRNYIPNNTSDTYIDDSSTLVIHCAHHYSQGTGSLARTFHFGTPSLTEIHAYTLTLASLISYSRQIFPSNIRTSELDVLARTPLWAKETDYNHSTGHGIGAFSSYHEPPININRNSWSQMQVLQKDYFITVGPSQRKRGTFGIELENVVHVKKTVKASGDYLRFEETTLVPFETKLIEPSLLSPEQVEYINAYHAKVLQVVGAELKRQSSMKGFYWLMEKTKTISPSCNSCRETVSLSLFAVIFMFSVRYLL